MLSGDAIKANFDMMPSKKEGTICVQIPTTMFVKWLLVRPVRRFD